MFADITPLKLIIVAGIIMLMFGGKKLKEFSVSLAEAITSFKKVMNDGSTSQADTITSSQDDNKKSSS